MSVEENIEELFKDSEEHENNTDWDSIIKSVDKLLSRPSIQKIINIYINKKFPDSDSGSEENKQKDIYDVPEQDIQDVSDTTQKTTEKTNMGEYMYDETLKFLETLKKVDSDMTVKSLSENLPVMKDSFIEKINEDLEKRK